MQVYDLRDDAGRVFAFQVNNFLLTRRGVPKAIRTIPGARITVAPRFLAGEEFCEFEVEGKTFVAWEPFGDNSVYWIGPKPAEWCKQVATVRDAFLRYEPRGLWPWLARRLKATASKGTFE